MEIRLRVGASVVVWHGQTGLIVLVHAGLAHDAYGEIHVSLASTEYS